MSGGTIIFCPMCGTQRNSIDNFCSKCGYQFLGSQTNYSTLPQNNSPQPPITPRFNTVLANTILPFLTQPSLPTQRKRGRVIALLVLILMLIGAGLIGIVIGKVTSSGNSSTTQNNPSHNSSPHSGTPLAKGKATTTVVVPTPTLSPSPTPTATVSPSPTLLPPHRVLYQANWSNGANGWSYSPDWKFFNHMLINTGTDNLCSGSFNDPPTAIPPFQPQTADYAIEIQVQIVRQTDNGCVDRGCLGIVGRGTPTSSFWTGYQGVINYSSQDVVISDYSTGLGYTPINRDNSWHMYRFELKGTTLTLFVDGKPLLVTSDAKYITSGQIGLWSAGLYLNIRSYVVTSL